MADFKSKLPDLKELADMTGKFFKDIKNSVCEIIEDYQKKREDNTQPSSDVTSSPEATPPADEEKKTDKPQP